MYYGFFNDWSGDKDPWVEFISWDYIENSGECVFSVELGGDRDVDASYG